jgi:hypothetical protein
VVPALVRLLRSGAPSGRYRAAALDGDARVTPLEGAVGAAGATS